MRADNIYLKKATVCGVLGEYTHEIEFKDSQRFIILHGPNGVGKTKFLEIINASINFDPVSLINAPFESAEFEFSNGDTLKVRRSYMDVSNGADSKSEVAISFLFESSKYENLETKNVHWKFAESDIENVVKGFERELRREFFVAYGLEEKIIALEELQKQMALNINFPSEILELKKSLKSFLIETQRLRSELNLNLPHRLERLTRSWGETKMKPRIIEQSNKIKDLLTKAQKEHSKISQRLDNTFPSRVLLKDSSLYESVNEQKVLEQYEQQSAILNHLADIFGDAVATKLEFPERSLEPWELVLLNQYIDDTKQKLEPFNKLLDKIKILEKIINNRFSNKKLMVTGEGLVVQKEATGQILELTELSSGEQHEIILMTDLLLNVPEGAIVLIDEPEISLHVAWQIAFISDIEAIAENANYRFIVATHSPQIINDNWDCTVRLGH